MAEQDFQRSRIFRAGNFVKLIGKQGSKASEATNIRYMRARCKKIVRQTGEKKQAKQT